MAEENMYDDGPAQQPPPSGGKSDAGKSESGEHTSLLPKSILMGKDFKVGDEVVLKIEAIHGDSVEVAYAPEKGGEEEYEGDKEAEAPPEEQPQAPPPGAGNTPDGSMAAMMQ
jgi:hypothetical protein